jgi:hypothetical protein
MIPGNKLGWQLSALVAVIYVGVLVVLETSASTTAATSLSAGDAGVAPLDLPPEVLALVRNL